MQTSFAEIRGKLEKIGSPAGRGTENASREALVFGAIPRAPKRRLIFIALRWKSITVAEVSRERSRLEKEFTADNSISISCFCFWTRAARADLESRPRLIAFASRKCRRFGVTPPPPSRVHPGGITCITAADKTRTCRMQVTVGRPWLGRACGLEYAALIEPHLCP